MNALRVQYFYPKKFKNDDDFLNLRYFDPKKFKTIAYWKNSPYCDPKKFKRFGPSLVDSAWVATFKKKRAEEKKEKNEENDSLHDSLPILPILPTADYIKSTWRRFCFNLYMLKNGSDAKWTLLAGCIFKSELKTLLAGKLSL